MPGQPRFIEIALPCLARRWWVFPLQPRSKLPFKGSRGFKDATLDRAQVEAWGQAAPDANVGIATGPSGLVVLDLDGPEGQALLKAVARSFGQCSGLPRTLVVKTGRPGGYHVYYAGTDVPSSQVKGEHLDVRGSTGYVLAPGCVHENGTIYTIVVDSPVVAVPAWVGPWGRSRGKGVVPAERTSTHANGPHLPLLAGGAATTAQRALRALQEAEAQSWSPEAETRLRLALSAIPADIDGQTWASFGMALCDLHWDQNGQDVGFEIWDAWSKTSAGKGAGNGEYRGRADLAKRWRGFQEKNYQGARATVARIFAEAQRKGWTSENISRLKTLPEHTDHGTNDVKLGQVNGVAALPAPIFSSAPSIVFPDVTRQGRPLATCRNARLAIRGLGVTCAHDAFRDRCTIGGHPLEDWAGELTDNTVHILRVAIEQTYHFDPGTISTHDAAVQECLAASRDPVLDYLDSLTWDGRARLAGWLSVYLGAADTAFNRAVGPLVLVAAVRRAREPGCKFDQITVLEGPEGTLKSSAVRLLAGEWFSDQTLLGLGDREHQEALAGVWLYEIADLAGHTRAEVERMKAFASRTHDRARPAYGRSRVDRPRRCVLFATTNNETYLKSQTGNRRFWPIKCGRIDLEALKRDRDQLWAEAGTIEEQGIPLVLDRALWADAGALQSERLDYDPWDDKLAELETRAMVTIEGEEWRVASRDVLDYVLGADRQNDVSAKRLVYTMRRLGWQGPKVFWRNEMPIRGYTKPFPKEKHNGNSPVRQVQRPAG
jgi:hypothetical protein